MAEPQVALLPETVADADWMTCLTPYQRCHTAVALVPSADSALLGYAACCPLAEISVGVLHVAVLPEIVADAAWAT